MKLIDTGDLKLAVPHAPLLQAIAVEGGGNCGPSASAWRTVVTTVPLGTRWATQSTKELKTAADTEDSPHPLQTSWKTNGTQPPPFCSAWMTCC